MALISPDEPTATDLLHHADTHWLHTNATRSPTFAADIALLRSTLATHDKPQ